MSRNLILHLWFVICSNVIPAQDLNFTHYLLSGIYNINPAASGFDGGFLTHFQVSRRWIDVNGAPGLQLAGASTRLGDEGFYNPSMHINKPIINIAPKVGIGFTIFNETSGPIKHTGALAAYAFHIPMQNFRLSLGVSGSFIQYHLKTSKFKPVNTDDPLLYSDNSAFIPDVNFGILLYSKSVYLGFSANGILNINNVLDHTKTSPDFVFCGSYRIKTSKFVDFEPSTYAFINSNSWNYLDLHTRIIYRDLHWLLLSYKTLGEVNAGIGIGINSGITLGYIYNFRVQGSFYGHRSQSFSLRVDLSSLIKKRRA